MSATDPALAAAQWAEARRWFAKANEDQRSAALILAADPPLIDPAAYHCQQAGEKLLKGLLAGAGVAVPKTHDLKRLGGLVIPLFPALTAHIEAVSDLTPWGTATRYPCLDAELGVMPQDIRDALAALDRLHEAAIALHPIK